LERFHSDSFQIESLVCVWGRKSLYPLQSILLEGCWASAKRNCSKKQGRTL